MVPINEGIRSILEGIEVSLDSDEADNYVNYVVRRDQALATIVTGCQMMPIVSILKSRIEFSWLLSSVFHLAYLRIS